MGTSLWIADPSAGRPRHPSSTPVDNLWMSVDKPRIRCGKTGPLGAQHPQARWTTWTYPQSSPGRGRFVHRSSTGHHARRPGRTGVFHRIHKREYDKPREISRGLIHQHSRFDQDHLERRPGPDSGRPAVRRPVPIATREIRPTGSPAGCDSRTVVRARPLRATAAPRGTPSGTPSAPRSRAGTVPRRSHRRAAVHRSRGGYREAPGRA